MKDGIHVDCVETNSKTTLEKTLACMYNEYDVINIKFNTPLDKRGNIKYCALIVYKEKSYNQVQE